MKHFIGFIMILFSQVVIGQVPPQVSEHLNIRDTSGLKFGQEILAGEELEYSTYYVTSVYSTSFITFQNKDIHGNITNSNRIKVWLKAGVDIIIYFIPEISIAGGTIKDDQSIELYYPMNVFDEMNKGFQKLKAKENVVVNINRGATKTSDIMVRIGHSYRTFNGEVQFLD